MRVLVTLLLAASFCSPALASAHLARRAAVSTFNFYSYPARHPKKSARPFRKAARAAYKAAKFVF